MIKEIEVKALLSKNKYEELKKELPLRFSHKLTDSVKTVKFKPDIRVRYSEKRKEIVFKGKDDPSKEVCEEITISLGSLEDCEKMITMLRGLGLKEHPSWMTHRDEFSTVINGQEYSLSLQHIPNFAYILEAEAMAENEDKHLPILREIISSLGCKPLDKEEFTEKVMEYREKYKYKENKEKQMNRKVKS